MIERKKELSSIIANYSFTLQAPEAQQIKRNVYAKSLFQCRDGNEKKTLNIECAPHKNNVLIGLNRFFD